MIRATQIRIARNLLGIDQRKLAEMSGLSRRTIQRMEAADHGIRGDVDDLEKIAAALAIAGVFPVPKEASDDVESGVLEKAVVTRPPSDIAPYGKLET